MAKNDARQIMIQQPQPFRVRMPQVGGHQNDDVITNDPTKWFADKFPEQAQQYGAAFLEGTCTDAKGLKRLIPA